MAWEALRGRRQCVGLSLPSAPLLRLLMNHRPRDFQSFRDSCFAPRHRAPLVRRRVDDFTVSSKDALQSSETVNLMELLSQSSGTSVGQNQGMPHPDINKDLASRGPAPNSRSKSPSIQPGLEQPAMTWLNKSWLLDGRAGIWSSVSRLLHAASAWV